LDVPLNIECPFDVMFWIKRIVTHRLTAQFYFRPILLPGLLSSITTYDRSVANSNIHLYRIYSNPTHDKHQWLLLQFIVLLTMDAKGFRNM